MARTIAIASLLLPLALRRVRTLLGPVSEAPLLLRLAVAALLLAIRALLWWVAPLLCAWILLLLSAWVLLLLAAVALLLAAIALLLAAVARCGGVAGLGVLVLLGRFRWCWPLCCWPP